MVSAFRILGEGQLSLTKFLLVADGDVDPKDFPSMLQHVLERTCPEVDLYVLSNLSMDTLDYTGPEVNLGSKGIWLGLGEPVRSLPAEYSNPETPSEITDVRVFCPGCLVVGGPGYTEDPEMPARIAQHRAFQDWPLIVLSDEPRRAASSSVNFLWTTFTRFEPAADIHSAGNTVDRHHIRYRFPIVIDARMKPPYPEELFCDERIAKRVTNRWTEYFPDRKIEMGDSDRAHLDPP
jgi:3-polyprenyl-4-hydroxybenzoate decarboxylase